MIVELDIRQSWARVCLKWVELREWFRFGFLSRVLLAPTSFLFDLDQQSANFRWEISLKSASLSFAGLADHHERVDATLEVNEGPRSIRP